MNREVHNEQEMLDKNERAVSRLVAGLKHVEAPANFERRVMSKIAEGKPQRRGFFAFPAVVYVVPALLVVLVVSFFVFKPEKSPEAQLAPVAAANTIAQPQASPSLNSVDMPEQPNVALVQPGQSQTSSRGTEPKAVKQGRVTNGNRGGGSYLEALPNKKAPMPEGLENNSPSAANSADVMTSTPIPVKEILDNLGMSVEFENGWQVKTVTDSGPAQRTGVKVGDIIIALDDRELDLSTSYKGFGSVRTVTVRRGGKLLPLKIASR
jgi:hypothetical protein